MGVDQCGTGRVPHFSAWWGRHRKCPLPHTFLLARDLILSQFSIDCCRNPFASGALLRTPLGGGACSPPGPQLEKWGSHTQILRSANTKNEPPLFQILATGLIALTVICRSTVLDTLARYRHASFTGNCHVHQIRDANRVDATSDATNLICKYMSVCNTSATSLLHDNVVWFFIYSNYQCNCSTQVDRRILFPAFFNAHGPRLRSVGPI